MTIPVYEASGERNGYCSRIIELHTPSNLTRELELALSEFESLTKQILKRNNERNPMKARPTAKRKAADRSNRATSNRNAHTPIPETDAEKAGLTTKQKLARLRKQLPGMVKAKPKAKKQTPPKQFSYTRFVDHEGNSQPYEYEFSSASSDERANYRAAQIATLRRMSGL